MRVRCREDCRTPRRCREPGKDRSIPAGWCTSSWRASRCEALSVAARPTSPDSTRSIEKASFRGYHTIARSWSAAASAALHRAKGLGEPGDSCLPWGYIPRHGVGRTTVFWSARGRAQRRRRFGPARIGDPLTPIRIPCSSTASHEEPRDPQRRLLTR
jgi:hypothetical protein